MADNRARHWACIVYQESAPRGWMQTVADWHMKALISPIHDEDTNADTGEVKKPHWHVVLTVDGKISEEQARARFAVIGGVGCERVGDLKAYARYLCHLDEREGNGKARYNTGEVQMFGGLDYFELIETARTQANIIAEMQEWCDETETVLLSVLNRYAREERQDWWRVLCTTRGVNVMKSYLQSLEYEQRMAR